MAINVRKLSREEADRAFPKRGEMDLSEYAAALRQLQPGDAAEVNLGGLTPRAMKRRLGQAAKQEGKSLKWARDAGTGALQFQVRTPTTTGRRGPRKAAAPAAAEPAPARRRGGRPPKAASGGAQAAAAPKRRGRGARSAA